jgi:hypothetical protein
MATQWHTAFAHLLRPMVEDYYEVATNVPVGDLPREADVVLLRRTARANPPFHGLWRRLTEWNILEYKGPSVSPRLQDVDYLVELGLGIHRRLNEERKKKKQDSVPPNEVSFWYLANRLGPRYFEGLMRRGLVFDVDPRSGWSTSILNHPLYLVSTFDLPVEPDSLPFHLLGVDSEEKKSEVARLVNEQPELKDLYKQAWASLHPDQLQEFLAMARSSKKGVTFHLMPLVEVIGWKEAIHQLGPDQLLDQLTNDEADRRKVLQRLVGRLSDAERNELLEQLAQKKRRKS